MIGEHYTVERYESRAEWLEARRKRIHASDVPSILGVPHAFGSAVSVWGDKTEPPLFEESSERFDIGSELEAPVGRLYQKKFGGKVTPWPSHTIAVSRRFPWLAATPDVMIEQPGRNGRGNGQIKTASEFARKEWADGAPLVYQVQCQVEALVLGCQWSVIPVLFGCSAVESIPVERNETFIEAMIPALEAFWACVEMRTMPAVDGSPATGRALARLHPNDNGLAVALPPDADTWFGRWQRLKSLRKRVDDQIGAVENRIKAAIGDNTYGTTDNGEWLSWKTTERKGYTVEPTSFRQLRTCKEPKQVAFAEVEQVDFKVEGRRQLPRVWKERLLEQYPRCCWCGKTLTMRTATFEHRVPLAVGGTNQLSNLTLACRECNEARGCDASLAITQGA